MTPAILDFGRRWLTPDVCRANVIEFGSRNVNGSLRGIVEPYAERYLGVDIEPGPGVDWVCAAEDSEASGWDLVICTEMLEHAEDWRGAVEAIKRAALPGGYLLVTTRSPGFPRHDYPSDHWRFTADHMRAIFADCRIIALEPDPEHGIMLFAQTYSLDGIEPEPAP